MTKKMKILHLEDLLSDSELVDRELKKAGLDFEKQLVENKPDFIRALREYAPDIILSDHSLPSFDSQEALKTVKRLEVDIPFILVTATVSEEYAVSIMKQGASDYVLKDRLQRLPSAILSAIERYRLEQERKTAVDVLRASERKYKLLFERNPMPMWMVNKSTQAIIDVNESATRHYGYPKEEFLTLRAGDLICEQSQAEPGFLSAGDQPQYTSGRWKLRTRSGNCIYVEILSHDIVYEEQPSYLVLANDITENVRAEAALASHRTRQEKLLRQTSIQAQEKERKEIGIELHDNINQILSAAKLYLESAVEETSMDTQNSLLQKGMEHVGLAIREIRQLSHRLVAPPFTRVGLLKAIREQLDNLSMVSPVRIQLEDEGFNEDLANGNIKLVIFRIIQEQLTNIFRHADARNGEIRLATTEERIELVIRDDGRGFDAATATHGIGLRNIANRVELYNGSMELVSAPDKGCTLHVTLPVLP